jgi:hypothetical protein
MRFLIAFYCACLTIWICYRIVRLSLQGRVELLSLHSIFLAGFIIFQLTSSVLGLGFSLYGDIEPSNLTTIPLLFAAYVTIFLIIFEWSYRREWGILRRMRLSRADWDGDASGWIILGIVMVFFGFLLKVVLVMIPLVGIISSQMAGGVLAIAAGCAGWAWAKDFRNPGLAAIAISIVIAASMIMMYRSFGRRPMVGVVLGFSWAIYYAYWRGFPKPLMLRRLFIAGIIASLVLTLYTATRKSADQFEKRGFTDAIRAITEVNMDDLTSGYVAILSGQNSGPISMWALETYGSAYPYNFLHQVKFLATMPVPRNLWPGKPNSLAKEMVYHGFVRNKGSGNVYNVGPGIIGHAAYDFPFIALPLYAIGLGWMLRIVDERTRWSLHRPFVILPCGAALGHAMALARGETALFVWEIMLAIIGGYFVMRIAGIFVSGVGFMWQTDEVPPYDPLAWDDDEEDYSYDESTT